MRVMVPPEGMGVVGVKARVTRTKDLPATRSLELITNTRLLTWFNETVFKPEPSQSLIAAFILGTTGIRLLSPYPLVMRYPPHLTSPLLIRAQV